MSFEPYSQTVREYFSEPTHHGLVQDAAAGYFEDQGLRILLSAVAADGILTRIRFQAFGCPHVIAACEAFCRDYEDRPVAALDNFNTGWIMQHLAVPVEKTGRILVLEDTVRSLKVALRDRTASSTQD